MRQRPMRHTGFTMVELIVAAIILVVIAGATTTALSQMLRARAGSAARQQAAARANGAAARIARDIAEASRDSTLMFAKVMVADAGESGLERDSLLLLTRSMTRVRGLDDEPEGGDFEAQYRVEPSLSGAALWGRADPALDAAIDGGGIASAIAPGLVAFSIEASDGQEWWPVWDSDTDGLPHGIRFSITATDDSGRARAVVRRVLALDRTPLPPPEAEDSESSTGGAS